MHPWGADRREFPRWQDAGGCGPPRGVAAVALLAVSPRCCRRPPARRRRSRRLLLACFPPSPSRLVLQLVAQKFGSPRFDVHRFKTARNIQIYGNPRTTALQLPAMAAPAHPIFRPEVLARVPASLASIREDDALLVAMPVLDPSPTSSTDSTPTSLGGAPHRDRTLVEYTHAASHALRYL